MNFKICFIGIIFFLHGMMPCPLFPQSPAGFELTGHLNGLDDGLAAILWYYDEDKRKSFGIDSCVVANGRFALKGKDYISKGPRAFHIAFFKTINGHSFSEGVYVYTNIDFFVDNGDKMAVTGNIRESEVRDVKISGSRSNDAANWALSLAGYVHDSCRNKIVLNLRKIRDSIGYDRSLVEEQVNARRNMDRYLDSATRAVPPGYESGIPYLIIMLNAWLGIYHGYFQKDLYAKLPPAVQNSYFGQQARNMAALSIGQQFPTFSLPDPEGNKIALKDFLQKGKITLVHFWGTTSVERNKYQAELKTMYGKFHDKGLNVIAISADTAKDDWELMIHVKKYPWTNVLAEPKGWGKGSLINDVYGEGGHWIPNTTNVLLDSKGIILAWDIEGPEFQWYLEKYLGG